MKFSDIQNLYGNGNGDFKITPVFDIDSVVEESPATGNLEFYRNGKRLKVNGLTIDDLSITNGRITFLGEPDENHVYPFSFILDSNNTVSNIGISNNLVSDLYLQGNDPASISTMHMYRSVTRGRDLIAWWPFDDDKLESGFAASKTASGLGASLYNSKISMYGRFGKGVHFLKNKSNARIKIENNGVDLGNSWTLSAWAKNVFPPSQTGKSTLFRGQGKQSNRDWDRYLTIRGTDRLICFFDGDEGNANISSNKLQT